MRQTQMLVLALIAAPLYHVSEAIKLPKDPPSKSERCVRKFNRDRPTATAVVAVMVSHLRT